MRREAIVDGGERGGKVGKRLGKEKREAGCEALAGKSEFEAVLQGIYFSSIERELLLFLSLARALATCRRGRRTTDRCVDINTENTPGRVSCHKKHQRGLSSGREDPIRFFSSPSIATRSSPQTLDLETKKKKKKKKKQAGTDGNDPARRKAARTAASACAVLAALRTLWCVAVPTAAGVAFPATALAVAAAALAASFLRAAGSGFGVPHKEKLALLKLHAGPAVAALVATQLAALAVDHGLTPKERRRPAQLVAALSSLSSSPSSLPSPAAVETVEKCVEGALDAALLAAAVASAVAGRRYLRMKQAK